MQRWTKILLLVLVFACTAFLRSRSVGAAADWPPINPDELALKDNPAQPGSEAMILYRESIVNSKESSEVYYFRIKIFTDAGKKHADVELQFTKGLSEVKEIRARTIHPDGRVIDAEAKVLEKVIVKAGDVRVLAKTLTLPDVTPGSIIEYRYKIQRDPNALYNITWWIQHELYTKRGHFVFQPYREEGAPPILWRGYRIGSVAPQRQKDSSWSLDINDVPGLPDEEFMLPENELRGHIEFVYSNEEHPKDPKEYWDRVAKGMAEAEEKFFGKRAAIRDLVAQITKPEDSPEAKLRKLYDRAQQIHNIDDDPEKTAQEAKRQKVKDNNNAEDVLKHGAADAGEIDAFFVALAQAAGFDAGLLHVTPRNESRFHPEMQDRHELTDFLVWVHAGDKDYFLDPGISVCPFGALPWYETNISGLRATKQGAVFLQVPAAPSSSSTIERHVELTLDPDGTLAGTFTIRYTGQRAFTRRRNAREQDETGRNKIITDEVKEWLPSNARFDLTVVTGWDKSNVPLEAQGKLRLPGMAESVGRRILLPVGLYEAGHRQLFDNAMRKQDVYFHFPYEEFDDITITLPANWKAETLPAPQILDPGGMLHYEITAKQDGFALHIQRKLAVGGILYPVTSYSGLRAFFSTAKADDEQQVVIQAAAPGRN